MSHMLCAFDSVSQHGTDNFSVEISDLEHHVPSSFDLTPATEEDAEPGLHGILEALVRRASIARGQAFKIFSAGKSVSGGFAALCSSGPWTRGTGSN